MPHRASLCHAAPRRPPRPTACPRCAPPPPRRRRRVTAVARAQVLDDWIQQSSSLAFRMQSWKSLRDKHRASGSSEPGSNMMTFLGHKAIQNRRLFLEALQDQLAKASGVTSFLMRLCSLVARLQHPCLRLQLLQYITGVDERFVVDLFKQTCEFAFQCVAEA